MNKLYVFISLIAAGIWIFVACGDASKGTKDQQSDVKINDTIKKVELVEKDLTIEEKLSEYAEVSLNADISALTDKQKKMIKILFEVADIIDDIFWQQFYGDKKELLSKIKNEAQKKYALINYGPWDIVRGMKSFVDGYEQQPLGANFYPADIKYLEYVDMKFEDKYSMFTLLRRDDNDNLYTIPYCKAFKPQLEKISSLLKNAAEYCEDPDFKKYLILRADAFLNDNFLESDLAWMDLKDNKIEFIAGPIEDEPDRFLNTKTGYLSYILLKNDEWNKKMQDINTKFAEIMEKLPLDKETKPLIPVSKHLIDVYNVLNYSGNANAGPKTISIYHPRDGRVHIEKGSRKLMFYNSTKAKFDIILKPIADLVIADKHAKDVTFDAFFISNLFYEVADAMVINKTVKNEKTKDVLRGSYTSMNKLRADIFRLFLMTEYFKINKASEEENIAMYATFISNSFRSIRFGASNAQGIANVICVNYFIEKGGLVKTDDGKYLIDVEKMKAALSLFTKEMVSIFAYGDINKAMKLIDEQGKITNEIQSHLNNINEAGIPRDIYFKQGPEVLGL